MNKTQKFKKALLALMAIYQVELIEHDDYGVDDLWCGSHFNFESNRDAFHIAGDSDVYLPISDI